MKRLLVLLALVPLAARAETVTWFCEGDKTVYGYKNGGRGKATLWFLDKTMPTNVEKEKVKRVDEELGVSSYYWTFVGSGGASFTAVQSMVRAENEWNSWPYLVQRCRGHKPTRNIYAGCATKTRTAFVFQDMDKALGPRGARVMQTRDYGNNGPTPTLRSLSGKVSKGADYEMTFVTAGLTYRLNLKEPAQFQTLKDGALLESETCLFTAADRDALNEWMEAQAKAERAEKARARTERPASGSRISSAGAAKKPTPPVRRKSGTVRPPGKQESGTSAP